METNNKFDRLSFESLQDGQWQTTEAPRLEMPKPNGEAHETLMDKFSDAYHKLLDLLHLS